MMAPRVNSKRIYSLLLILILGGIYARTLLPGVGYSGDTAKFQFLGHVLGISHPTGYPLYLMLNYLFTTLLPWGSLAYKVNLLSALFSLATCVFLFGLLLRLEVREILAFSMALAFGLTPTLWSQSIVAEVYSLNLMFAAGVFYFLILWATSRQDRHLLVALALYALSFGHHLLTLTLLPGIVYYVWSVNKQALFKRRNILLILLFVVISLLQYSYLFFRSYADVPDAYREWTVLNLGNFWRYVTAQPFQDLFFSLSFHQLLLERIPQFLQLWGREFLPLGAIAIYGVTQLEEKRTRYFLLLCALGNVIFALNYAIPDIEPFFTPVYLVSAIFMGVGIEKMLPPWKGRRVLPALVLVIPLIFLLLNFSVVNQHDNVWEAAEVEDALQAAGQDALILCGQYHWTMYFNYYLVGEEMQQGRRIYLADHFPDDLLQSYIYGKEPVDFEYGIVYTFAEDSSRIHLPANLAVYLHDRADQYVDKFRQYGFSVVQVREGFYRLGDQPTVDCESNWYHEEQDEGPPFRWMSNDATWQLGVPYDGWYRLTFTAASFHQERQLQFIWDGEILDQFTVGPAEDFSTQPLFLPAGRRRVVLHVEEGCASPFGLGQGEDYRCLSVRIWEPQLERLESP